MPESQALDIATGFFEIGSLLALDTFWNNLQKVRIIMGDETTQLTNRNPKPPKANKTNAINNC
ncbi:MAG: hypothetical protein KJ666_04175 [Bacteroidetes bacterium]|nr:hypothetical protein [Bacteroidota bacterium]MBU2583793.1 hypothetical protein [Bacteroidota bacterium]